jgi:hypothetical protein
MPLYNPGIPSGGTTDQVLKKVSNTDYDVAWDTDETGAGPGGGFSVTEIEQNLGSTPAWRGKFTITDAGIDAASRVLVWQAPGPYTGKGTLADESEMDWIQCHTVPGAGSAVVHWRSVQGFSGDQGHVNMKSGVAKVIGRVRGNIKFHYTIGA